MATADLVAELGTTYDGRPLAIFRERPPSGRIVYCVYSYPWDRADGAIADAYLADRDRWYWVRADGHTSVPGRDGPWLGWLLDLAREHGWEP